MAAINLGVGCCIPGVVCTLSSWKTAEFSNTTNFHCCINGSSADQCYMHIFTCTNYKCWCGTDPDIGFIT